MKKLIIPILAILLVSCGENVKDGVSTISSIQNSNINGFKYQMRLSVDGEMVNVYTNTDYQVGDTIKLTK